MPKPTSYRAATYVWMIPRLTEIARDYGYALGVHGSMHRDLDLIAVPWVDDARSPAELIEALRQEVDGFIVPDGTRGGRYDAETGQFAEAIVNNPERKPHGRLAWNIHLNGGLVLDISVMAGTQCPNRE